MLVSRRVRTVAAVGALAVALFKKQTPGRAVVGDWDNRP
jgi:hypothetical protein